MQSGSGRRGQQRYNPFRDKEVEHFPDLEEAFGRVPRVGRGRERESECEESLWSPESQAVLYGEDFSLHNDTADANAYPEAFVEEESEALEYWESHPFTRTPLGPRRPLIEGIGDDWMCSTPLGDTNGAHCVSSAGGASKRDRNGRRSGECESRRGRQVSALSEVDRNTFCLRDMLESSGGTPLPCDAPPRPMTPPYEELATELSPPGESRHAPRSRLKHSPSGSLPSGKKNAVRKDLDDRDTRRRDEKDPSLPLEFRTLLLLQRVAREMNAL